MRFLRDKKKCILIIYLPIVSLAFIVAYYVATIYNINKTYRQLYYSENQIGLRKFPYPYKAALSIASDIDETSTAEEFMIIQEFLNTKNMTGMGEGVGLEIGNSFFTFEPDWRDNFSYFSNRPIDKKIIRQFIKAGYIDFIHSWGDGYKDRKDALTALEELKKYNLKLKVWVNHRRTPSNLGNFSPGICLGDNRDTNCYHADVTIPYGIKFIWDYSTTYIIGQATQVSVGTFTGSYDPEYPLKSMRNIAESFVKHFLSVYGLWKNKYSLHAANDLVKAITLDDGQKVYEFMRYDNHPDGIGSGAISKTMAYNLSERVIEQLKKVHGYAILYAHFGRNSDCQQPICEQTQRALRYLEKQYQSGEVYVTTTEKLLTYYIIHKYLKWSSKTGSSEVKIQIHSVDDPLFGTFVPTVEELNGITFYVPSEKNVRININGREIDNLIRNPADKTNRESVTIPFTFLEYPDLTLFKSDLDYSNLD